MKLLPNVIKEYIKKRLKRATIGTQEIKYEPYRRESDTYVIPAGPSSPAEGSDDGLAIPPRAWWFEYGATGEEWLAKGRKHTNVMLQAVDAAGMSLGRGDRILDIGCGCGRMVRHLKSLADSCEIWGTDIWAEQIYWDRQHLSPPFHFATNTTVPHLPFEDRSFRLVYCGSLFTHIDDLAEAWLLEISRILSPEGLAYITIHDNHTLELLAGAYQESWLAGKARCEPSLTGTGDTFGMVVINRDTYPQVFYNIDYFRRNMGGVFDIVRVIPEAYGYQTGVLMRRSVAFK